MKWQELCGQENKLIVIPYIYIPTIQIGPITIQVWGLAVSLGILVSLFIAKKVLQRRGLDSSHLTSLAFWIIIGSFLGARIFHIAFYEPKFFLANISEIFKIWHGGLSSYGGFAGAFAAAFLFFKLNHVNPAQYVHAILFAFPWGWAVGRVGCFLIHDHPGTLTNSILGVKYPDGARFDLGLIEIFNGLGMGVAMIMAQKFKAKDNIVTAVGLLWYAAVRCFTDFLRATDLPGADARYFNLTPAQYGSIILVIFASSIFIKQRSHETP